MVEKSKFIQWLSAKGLSEASKDKYAYYFDRFPSQNFTQDAVNEYLAQPENTNPNCRAFVNNLKNFLVDEYPNDPTYFRIKIPKKSGRKERKLPDFPTEAELVQIEQAMTEERNKLMLLVSFYGGLRPAGMLSLRAVDFNWKEWRTDTERSCQLKVIEKGRKERIVLIPCFVMVRLANWIKTSRLNLNPATKLWGIGYRRWHFFLTEACKKALGRSLSPHKLRHGCGTWLLTMGWTLQEISDYLGHDGLETTRIYVHLDKSKMRSKFDDMFSIEQTKTN